MALQTRLKMRSGLRQSRGLNAAEVVLWAAEWFRRCYAGGPMRWDDVNAALGWHLDQHDWRDLVDRGLAAWNLRPLRIGGATYRLRSLAQQGGFPVAAIKDRGAGGPCAFLERLVAALVSEKVIQVGPAFSYAEALYDALPQTWRGEHFYLLCADLAVAIVKLREEAAQGGALGSAVPSAWLDANRPGWRGELPLSVDDGGARQLVDALMRVAPARSVPKPVRAARLLARFDTGWQEQARFDLAGNLSLPEVPAGEWSRLRLFAAGALARYVSGELGAVEADENYWLSSPSATGSKSHQVPFACALEIEARGAGRRVAGPIALPQGQPVDGPFLVCRADDTDETVSGETELPRTLVLLGASGGRFQADPVFVLANEGWTTSSTNGSVELADQVNGKVLWRLSGTAILCGPDGDRYQLRTGCPTDSLPSLMLHLYRPNGARVHGATDVLSWGMPQVQVRFAGRSLHSGAVVWRHVGELRWRPLACFDGIGLCEFGLRDSANDFWLDRQRCLVLPAEFQTTTERRADASLVRVANWPGTHRVDSAERQDDAWRLPLDGRGRAEVTVRLFRPGQQPAILLLRLPQRGVIATWSGDVIAPRTQVGLADLGELVARSEGGSVLHAMLRDNLGCAVPQAGVQWNLGDELPLGSIRADIAALLRPAGIDAAVDLQFSDSERIWRIVEFSTSMPTIAKLLAVARPDDRLVARHLQDAATEVEISSSALDMAAPSNLACHEPGCSLVFLRRGRRVVSRPLLERAAGPESVSCGDLGNAMALAGHIERQLALDTLLEQAPSLATRTTGSSSTILSDLVRLVTNLDDLPPSTFDPLAKLPHHPRVLAHMLFTARDDEVASLLALVDGLPFAWPLIPQRCWADAANRMGGLILEYLATSMAPAESFPLAASIVASRKYALAKAEPTLAPLLDVALRPPSEQPSLMDAMMAYMRENHDERQGGSSPFRPNMQSMLPDVNRFDSRFWRALDAPCAAAVAAVRELTLPSVQLRCVKDIHRRHPRYFEQAFVARWRELTHVGS